VFDNGQYYVFAFSSTGSGIGRFDMGATLYNTSPAYSTLGKLGTTLAMDMLFYRENNIWYLFSLDQTANAIFRTTFGNGLQAAPTNTDNLGNPGGLLNGPIKFDTLNNGTSKSLIIANTTGQNVVEIRFGNSWNNMPTAGATLTLPVNNNLAGISAQRVCGGFVIACMQNNRTITFLETNGNLGVTNTTSFTSASTGLPGAGEIKTLHDGLSWKLCMITGNNNNALILDLGANLRTPNPVVIRQFQMSAANPANFWSFDVVPLNEGQFLWMGLPLSSGSRLARWRFDQTTCFRYGQTRHVGPTPPLVLSPTDTTAVSALSIRGADQTPFRLGARFFRYPVTASFTRDTACVGSPTSFQQTTTGTLSGQSWLVDGTQTSTSSNFTFSPAAPGSYAITLTAQASDGQIDTLTRTIGIDAPIVASILAPNTACANDSFGLRASYVLPPSTQADLFFWNFGDGNGYVPGGDTLRFAYTQVGTYAIRVITQSLNGCRDTSAAFTIDVLPQPSAVFSVSQTCVGQSTSFQVSSPLPGAVYSWTIQGSPPLSGPFVQFNFPGPGSYTAKLVSLSPAGCKDSTVQTVVVTAPATLVLAGAPTSACQGLPVTLDASASLNADSYIWIIASNDTLAGPVINPVFSGVGAQTVQLIVRRGTACDRDTSFTISVSPATIVDFDFTGVCLGDQTQFSSLLQVPSGVSISSYSWDFAGLGTSTIPNPSFQFSAAGSYLVRLRVTDSNGCVYEKDSLVQLLSLPIVSATQSRQGTAITLSPSASFAIDDSLQQWAIDIPGIGAFTSVPIQINTNTLSPGNYIASIQVLSANGCISTVFTDTIAVLGLALDGFPTAFCQSDTLLPVLGQAVGVGNIAWDFCPGDFSSAPTLILQDSLALNQPNDLALVQENGQWFALISEYNALGLYWLPLGASPANGAIGPVVQAATLPNGTLSMSVKLAQQGPGQWSAFVATRLGNRIQRIDFDNGLGQPATAVVNLGDFGGQIADPRGIDLVTQNDTTYIIVSASTGNRLVVLSLNGLNLRATPTLVGTHTVAGAASLMRLAAMPSPSGNLFVFVSNSPNSVSRVEMRLKPFAVLGDSSLNGLSANTVSSFGGVALGHDGLQHWLFLTSGGNATNLTRIPLGASGNRWNTFQAITVNLAVSAIEGITWHQDSTHQHLFAIRRRSTTQADAALYRYDFPENCLASPQWVAGPVSGPVTFTGAGTFRLSVSARDALGTKYRVVDSLEVLPIPTLQMGLPTGCQNQALTFEDQTNSLQAPVARSWTVTSPSGSVLTNSAANATFVLNDLGDYQVVLQRVEANGCVSTLVDTLAVFPVPAPSFTFTGNCANSLLQAVDLTPFVPSQAPYQRLWTLGSQIVGSDSAQTLPQVAPGSYPLTLSVQNVQGCAQPVTQTIVIPGLLLEAGGTCFGDPLSLTAIPFYPNQTVSGVTWNLGDGSGPRTGLSIDHVYNAPGVYTVTAVVQTSGGCADTARLTVTIDPQPAVNFDLPASACVGSVLNLTDRSQSAPGSTPLRPSRWWITPPTSSIPDTLSGRILQYPLADTGVYQIELVVETQGGCRQIRSRSVRVLPQATLELVLPDSLCRADRLRPSLAGPDANHVQSVQWVLPATGELSLLSNPSFAITQAMTSPLTVLATVTDALGCTQTLSGTIVLLDSLSQSLSRLSALPGTAPYSLQLLAQSNTQPSGWAWALNGVPLVATGDTLNLVLDSAGDFRITALAQGLPALSCRADTLVFELSLLPPSAAVIDLALASLDFQYDSTSGYLSLICKIENRGNVPITRFVWEAEHTDGYRIRERWTGELLPGAQRQVALPFRIQAQRYPDPTYVCVRGLEPNDTLDAVPQNNEQCRLWGSDEAYFSAVYPSPASDQATLFALLPREAPVNIGIVDLAGRRVGSVFTGNLPAGAHRLPLPIASLPAGQYLLDIQYENRFQQRRFLVAR
jgi:PKD repeat protein